MAPKRQILNDSQSELQKSGTGGAQSTPSHILYDLNIFAEWSQDIENAVRNTGCTNLVL